MTHVIEPAASGRAKCRGCGLAISKGTLRFGEKLPNPFADEGDMTLWFHLECAAFKRPEAFQEVLDEPSVDASKLGPVVQCGLDHRRVVRADGVQRAPSGRARCRSCRETIEKDSWRIPLVFFEDGMFNASGFVHVTCAESYFETSDILDRVLHFSGDLEEMDIKELSGLLT